MTSPESSLPPIDTLFENGTGDEIPLPPEITAIYGTLRMPAARPYVIGNFVSSLDGVITLAEPDHPDGGRIAGPVEPDQFIMGLLRSVADVAVAGAGTLRSVPDHVWTPGFVYPRFAAAFRDIRRALGNDERPLNVIVTARGNLDLTLPVFQSDEVETIVVTTATGRRELENRTTESRARIFAAGDGPVVSARDVVAIIDSIRPGKLILLEGGPRLMGDFFAENCLDELFLTLAPQVAGRNIAGERPGLVLGRTFAPDHPVWLNLAGIKRTESQLYLRYQTRNGARSVQAA